MFGYLKSNSSSVLTLPYSKLNWIKVVQSISVWNSWEVFSCCAVYCFWQVRLSMKLYSVWPFKRKPLSSTFMPFILFYTMKFGSFLSGQTHLKKWRSKSELLKHFNSYFFLFIHAQLQKLSTTSQWHSLQTCGESKRFMFLKNFSEYLIRCHLLWRVIFFVAKIDNFAYLCLFPGRLAS